MLCLPAHSRADGQYSLRNILGVGKRTTDAGGDVIFPAGFRGEAMFGPPRHRTFRFGPALELATTDFRSLEAALGAGVLIPTGDFAFNLNGLVGYAWRKNAPEGLMGIGTLTWGYRGYNYHSWYGYGLAAFVSARPSITGDDVLFIKNLFTSDDPHQ